MKNFLRVIFILSILSSKSGAQVNETIPVGQDRGGAPAMNKMSGEVKVDSLADKSKLLPFYSLTVIAKKNGFKCDGGFQMLSAKNPEMKEVYVPIAVSCINKLADDECDVVLTGGKGRTEEMPAELIKVMKLNLDMGLEYYLSKDRVMALKDAQKIENGWAVNYGSSVVRVNEEMTEMTRDGSKYKFRLTKLDGYLFVTEMIRAKSMDIPLLGLKTKFKKKKTGYFPSQVDMNLEGKKTIRIMLKNCSMT